MATAVLAPATRDLRPATCDPRPATRDPCPATRDPPPNLYNPTDQRRTRILPAELQTTKEWYFYFRTQTSSINDMLAGPPWLENWVDPRSEEDMAAEVGSDGEGMDFANARCVCDLGVFVACLCVKRAIAPRLEVTLALLTSSLPLPDLLLPSLRAKDATLNQRSTARFHADRSFTMDDAMHNQNHPDGEHSKFYKLFRQSSTHTALHAKYYQTCADQPISHTTRALPYTRLSHHTTTPPPHHPTTPPPHHPTTLLSNG